MNVHIVSLSILNIYGLPRCVIYGKRTIFDLVFPFIFADEKIFAERLTDVLAMADFALTVRNAIFKTVPLEREYKTYGFF